MEQAAWTDMRGGEVPKTVVPAAASVDGWVVEVSSATDRFGWQYGTHFSHLGSSRIGGRASQRSTDFVRRRKWLLHEATAKQRERKRGSGDVAWLTAEHMLEAESQQQREASAALNAARAFISLFSELLNRNNLWTMLPWDPFSYSVVYQRHTAYLARMHGLLLPSRLLSAADIAAASNRPQDASPPLLNAAASAAPATSAEYYRRLAASPRSSEQSNGMDADREPIPVTLDEAMLEDLQAGVDFSRAAYGYAYMAGGLNSVLAYVHMQTLQRGYFDIISGASTEANNRAVASITGIQMDDILMAHWKNSTYRPCHLLAVDHKRKRLVLTVRGSLELGDLLTDLHAKPIHLSMAGVDCHVHEGMLRAATYVHCNTGEAIKSAHEAYPDFPLFLTGHSLGGGVATLLTLLLRQPGGAPERLQQNGITCMSMAAASTLSTNLAQLCEPFVTSVILGSDAIPRLSYYTVEALLHEISEASPARRAVGDIRSSLSAAFAPISQRLASLKRPNSPPPRASAVQPGLEAIANEKGSAAASAWQRAGRSAQLQAPLRFPTSPDADSTTSSTQISDPLQVPIPPQPSAGRNGVQNGRPADPELQRTPKNCRTEPPSSPNVRDSNEGGPHEAVHAAMQQRYDSLRREDEGTEMQSAAEWYKSQNAGSGRGNGRPSAQGTRPEEAQRPAGSGSAAAAPSQREEGRVGDGESARQGGPGAWGRMALAPISWLWSARGGGEGKPGATSDAPQAPAQAQALEQGPAIPDPATPPAQTPPQPAFTAMSNTAKRPLPPEAPSRSLRPDRSALDNAMAGNPGPTSSPKDASPLIPAEPPASKQESGKAGSARWGLKPPSSGSSSALLQPDDDPHAYLRERGIIPAVTAAAPWPSGDRQGSRQLPSSPVRRLNAQDAALLQEIDAAHLERELSPESPPPLFPAGRVLWLIPLKREAADAVAVPSSSTNIRSHPLQLDEAASDRLEAAVQQSALAHEIELRTLADQSGRAPETGTVDLAAASADADVTSSSRRGLVGLRFSADGSVDFDERGGKAESRSIDTDMLGPSVSPQARSMLQRWSLDVSSADASADVSSSAPPNERARSTLPRVDESGSPFVSSSGAAASQHARASSSLPRGRNNGVTPQDELSGEGGQRGSMAMDATGPGEASGVLQGDVGSAARQGSRWTKVAGSLSKALRQGSLDDAVAVEQPSVLEEPREPSLRDESYAFTVEDSSGRQSGGDDVDVAVIDVSDARNVFNYLTLTPDMVQDHLPDSYTRAVNAIRHAALHRAVPGKSKI